MKNKTRDRILIGLFLAGLAYNSITFVEAAPLEMGAGNRALLSSSYQNYQFVNRHDRYSMNVIRGIYAQERARQVCTNWRVYPQAKFNTCVLALSGEFVKKG